MSRTNHTTPSFPRALRGPRGGHHRAPTPCVVCVGFASCRPGACSAPYGCESWVDEDGRRVDILADLDPEPIEFGAHRPQSLEAEDCRADHPDPQDPDPYRPSSATLSEMSGIFPTDDPEPDGGRFTFETLGGLVKGRCGSPDPDEPDLHPAINTDPGPLFGGRESN